MYELGDWKIELNKTNVLGSSRNDKLLVLNVNLFIFFLTVPGLTSTLYISKYLRSPKDSKAIQCDLNEYL